MCRCDLVGVGKGIGVLSGVASEFVVVCCQLRLATWTVEQTQAPVVNGARNLIHGLFYDRRDVHAIITKARRDRRTRDLYCSGKLKCPGYVPPEVSADLKKLREAAGAAPPAVPYSVVSVTVQEEKPFLILPEVASLSFVATEGLKRRLDELSKEFPRPPPLKRPRGGVGSSGNDGPAEECYESVQKLLEAYTLETSGTHKIAALTLTVLRALRKSDSKVLHFIQNTSQVRMVINKGSHCTSTTKGIFLDRCQETNRARIRDDGVLWEWDINVNSMFCYQFGSASETIDSWQAMLEAGKKVNSPGETKLYGHNLADAQSRTSVNTRLVSKISIMPSFSKLSKYFVEHMF